MSDAARTVSATRHGDTTTAERSLPMVYGELRISRSVQTFPRKERPDSASNKEALPGVKGGEFHAR